ncbi:beta-ketothiolase BktB [Conexibacter sp. JD483]|uniref:beta-ketothiolase BktB n=1 Tax=unclassified Conexibacter TaxID=2627773 RepID=UPI002723A524|nr:MULTISPECIES: beta-ketothiolase BktB [unclassified Conexibacter]MDO8185484.1 beta-ketothiolase BktB [Conexibacter sp. CPCC 205706]MDO8197329.1 beta-ketothiolase BktB [Conexibacter sp. CPCC 205762]MDR9371093.1 beta-ketothiolase BktB [Conexibacter sp. JD483]
MTEVVIASAARTAVGGYGKSLKDVPPNELGAIAARAALERAGLQPEQVEHVVFGNVIHTEPRDMYMARVVGMMAGLPKETPAFTVNRLCGTGVQAIVSATQAIQSGDVEVALAGGCESMSRGPYWLPAGRWGARMGETTVTDPVSGALTDPFNDILMGVTAENLAEKHGITREEQDAFAVESHRRAAAARDAGKFVDEIVPVVLKTRKGEIEFKVDEHIRDDASLESMAKLKPVFKRDGGTVTAGNASGMNDAGAATVLLSAEKAAELGAPVRARILGYASCGVDPKIMGIGPVPAIRKVLDRTGVSLDQIGVFELNEAFAAQALAVVKELDLDPAKVNPNGGAVGLGHPISATGAVITTKAISELEREGHDYAIVSLCIGGGQGIALLLGKP